MKHIVEKRMFHIMRTGTESRFADLLIVTNPWVEGDSVPTSPRVADCVCPFADKVGLFQRLLFNKILVPTIMEGESSSNMVAGVCTKCLRSLGQTSSTTADVVMTALALRCITVYDAVAESLGALGALHGQKRSEERVSAVQSILVARQALGTPTA